MAKITGRLLVLSFTFLACISCAQESGDSSYSGTSGSGSYSSPAATGSSPVDDSATGPAVNSVSRKIEFCGTEDPSHDDLNHLAGSFGQYLSSGRLQRERALAAGNPIRIPVVFHVVSKGPAFEDGEVPDSMLIKQVDVLNQAFSGQSGGIDTPFRFELNGINRVRRPEWHVLSPGSEPEKAMKEELKQGDARTLNIYIADIEATGEVSGGRGKILGYTTLPLFVFIIEPYDGVVLNYAALVDGPLDHYNRGHVAVHEVGHWLGLLHTFTGECDGFFDDLVSDTPREKVPEKGDFCPSGRDSCPSVEGSDPVTNHMTYTGDECRSEFTEGQLDFMLFSSSLFRGFQVN